MWRDEEDEPSAAGDFTNCREERSKHKYVIKTQDAPVNEGLPRMSLFIQQFQAKKPEDLSKGAPAKMTKVTPSSPTSVKAAPPTAINKTTAPVVTAKPMPATTSVAATAVQCQQLKTGMEMEQKAVPKAEVGKTDPAFEIKRSGDDVLMEFDLRLWKPETKPPKPFLTKPEGCSENVSVAYDSMMKEYGIIMYMFDRNLPKTDENKKLLWKSFVGRWAGLNDHLRKKP